MALKSFTLKPHEPALELIRVISEGTYTSFPQALKEFVSNAYDAYATEVQITIDEDAERIVIRDDGCGMTSSDFANYYASIARTGPTQITSRPIVPRKPRKKIGRFGIGALAVASIARSFTVRSTKYGSNEGFEASIDLSKIRSQFGKQRNLGTHWVFDCVKWTTEPLENHFTEITMNGFEPDLWSQILRPGEREATAGFESVTQLSGKEELRWRLGVICPVSYSHKYPVPEDLLRKPEDSIVFGRAEHYRKQDFKVLLNKKPVLKPILLPSYDLGKSKDPDIAVLYNQRDLGFKLRCVKNRAGSVHFDGYIVIQSTQVFPEELRGILVRIRDVGVGWHRTINLSTTAAAPTLQSLSGELWVDGLEPALQFDRESFREDHPRFQDFKNYLESLLNEEAKEARERSAARVTEERRIRKQKSKAAKAPSAKAKTKPSAAEAATGDSAHATTDEAKQIPEPVSAGQEFIPEAIFADLPAYIRDTVRQVNGTWYHEYREACAVMIRRLLQILIIELYSRRGWMKELIDTKTGDLVGLKSMVRKVNGERRFGFDSRVGKGLDALKVLGDIGAHDHTIMIRKHDLTDKKDTLRYTCERLVFHITQQPTK